MYSILEMFREKLTNFQEKRGYLYIRESFYQRDRRTLKRKPSKLGDGSATKERGRYSKKKDIYCGKIYEIEPKRLDTFKYYVENKEGIDFLNFKLKHKFEEIIDMFVKYLLYIYEIDEDDFYNGKKKVYTVNEGYLSRETILWTKRFTFRLDFDNPKEIERFTYRCEDSGIYDDEIINTLYVKLVPNVDNKNPLENIKIVDSKDKQEHKNFKSFIKKSMN